VSGSQLLGAWAPLPPGGDTETVRRSSFTARTVRANESCCGRARFGVFVVGSARRSDLSKPARGPQLGCAAPRAAYRQRTFTPEAESARHYGK